MQSEYFPDRYLNNFKSDLMKKLFEKNTQKSILLFSYTF